MLHRKMTKLDFRLKRINAQKIKELIFFDIFTENYTAKIFFKREMFFDLVRRITKI